MSHSAHAEFSDTGAMTPSSWQAIVAAQGEVISRRQLYDAGVTRGFVRAQVAARRWCWRTESVLTTTTGPLSRQQRLWLGVLHCGPGSAIGGLTAAGVHGLRNWDRDEVTVVVDDTLTHAEIPGMQIIRTRRPVSTWLAPGPLPVLRIEPAILLFGAYDRSLRTAQGALAAVVQQGLTTPQRLVDCLATMRPLRRARHFRAALAEIGGGAQSVAELDVRRACRNFGVVPPASQTPRTDRAGRLRWTDCEWRLPDGRVLVLEVDGAFHLDVRQYDDDVRRQRRLVNTERIVVRCSAREIRDAPGEVMADLVALGVPRLPRAG